MEQIEEQFDTPAPDTEPGMNLISVDFDIIMVNRTNERLYAKPMVAMLGNKCYREFEKRDEPCPHCPGRLALETGEAQEAETTGLRDDGTRFAARIKAHPVIGPDNRPTGFIEIVEDITEQKRAESLAAIDGQLQTWLAGIQNVRSALREALRAALLVEGIDCGAAFILDGGDGPADLVEERGLAPACVEPFAEIARRRLRPAPPSRTSSSSRSPLGSPALLGSIAVVPILIGARRWPCLVVGSTVYPVMPASLRTGLQVAGDHHRAPPSPASLPSSRGATPSPTWRPSSPSLPWPPGLVDGRGCITMWNKAAEKMFGWRAGEVVGSAPPWGPEPPLPPAHAKRCWTERTGDRWRCGYRRPASGTWWATTRRNLHRRGPAHPEADPGAGDPGGRIGGPAGARRPRPATRRRRRRASRRGPRASSWTATSPGARSWPRCSASLGCSPVRCAAPEHTAAVLAGRGRPSSPSAWPSSLLSARAEPAGWASGRRFGLWGWTPR